MSSHPGPLYGGQALVEGVLIRSGERWAVALRKPDGGIHRYDGAIAPAAGLWTLPFLRGLRTLAVQFRLGLRALTDSSIMADTGEIRPLPALAIIWVVAVSLTIGLIIFTALPLLITGRDPALEASVPQRLSEGILKTGLLAVYVVGVTRLPRYRRIFSYHGAEHMAIACAEAGEPLTIENVSRHNPAHPRCGTGFLVILATVDTVILALLPRLGEFADLALRIGLVPVSAAIAYELLRAGSRRRGIGSVLNRFGILTQRLTTAYPDRGQMEVAIAAVEHCRAPHDAPMATQASMRAPAPSSGLVPAPEPVRVPVAADPTPSAGAHH